MNWLVNAASRAGLQTAAGVKLKAGTSVSEAWESIGRVAGLTPEELASRVAPSARLRVANLDATDRRALRLIPERIARQYNVIPVAENDRAIFIATADPMNLDAEQAIEFASGRRVTFELAPPDAITRALNLVYSANMVVDAVLAAGGSDAKDIVKVIDNEEPEPISALDVNAEPIVKLTNVVLRDAIVQNASDIHIEPGATGGTVRFRIDGLMRVHLQLPGTILTRIVSRIKVMSRLDIADRLRPQDGRARIQVDGRSFDLRISTVPTRDAEKAVIRILRGMTDTTLDGVGMSPREVERVRQLLANRDGIVAITGPTGSGKTTTIYSAIREVAATQVNLVTVEDPIEYEVPGITQIQVEPKRNVTFASALRSILRQDPDVIFIGEIRDLETAKIAVQAAMTGHLVLATVHANDAVGAVARLRDLGVDLPSIGATMRGSIAQRLVRRLCPECSIPVSGALTDDEQRLVSLYNARPSRRAVGCRACSNTGYRGRIPIAEVMLVNASIAEEITTGASLGAIQRTASAAGMRGLRESGLTRVESGETTLQEVERVLGRSGDLEEEQRPEDSSARAADARTTILVVDDDPVERRVARTALEKGGLRVIEAADGREALQQLGPGSPVGLVVTDLQMEHLDGRGLLTAVRAGSDTLVPVIVITGTGDATTEMELLDAGADDYIEKPLDPPRFLARVKATLRRHGVEVAGG